jgi:hypothetical protein
MLGMAPAGRDTRAGTTVTPTRRRGGRPSCSIRPTDRPAARQVNEDVLVLDALEAVARPPRLTRSPAHRVVSRVTRAGSHGPGPGNLAVALQASG